MSISGTPRLGGDKWDIYGPKRITEASPEGQIMGQKLILPHSLTNIRRIVETQQSYSNNMEEIKDILSQFGDFLKEHPERVHTSKNDP